MRRSVLVVAASLSLAAPLYAQTPPQADTPEAIAREGVAKLLQALKLFVDNLPQYAAPEIDAEGNIVIRRLTPPSARRAPPPADGPVPL
jgi:hypothetical protein